MGTCEGRQNSEENNLTFIKSIHHDGWSVQGVPGKIEPNMNKKIASWQELKYGMFIHWGLYSEIGGVWNDEPVKEGYSEQIQMWANIPDSEYMKVAKRFSAESFDPKEICMLAKEAGMNYIIITSKHHDGFCMFDTVTTDYNIVKSTPYGLDPLKSLAEECYRQGLKFGFYFSLVDWHQGHQFDKENNNAIPESMEMIIESQLRELLTNYGSICEVWFDMSSPTLKQSEKFVGIVNELQPGAVINSRVWNNMGDFRTLGDNEVPSVPVDGSWEIPASIYHETWGYRKWQVRNDFNEKVMDLLKGLISNGNYLLNVGPRGDGSIVSFEADVLRAMGDWLNRHPDVVFGTFATLFDEQPWGKVKANKNALYLIVTDWPKQNEITLRGLATDVYRVVGDSADTKIEWRLEGYDLLITMPEIQMDSFLPVIKVELKEELKVIPERTIKSDANGIWQMSPQDIYLSYGYTDKGNNQSMTQTIVRQSAYIVSQKRRSVLLKFKGTVDSQKRYRIDIGLSSHVITSDHLTTSLVGPFTVPDHEVIPFSITLAEPIHTGENLDLSIESVYLIPVDKI